MQKRTFLMKLILGFAASIYFVAGGFMGTVKADEGMWIPLLARDANYADMVKHGLKLTQEQLYSINNSSVKDAIVQFGNGCTGEIVSAEGLLFTNHHCGYGQIQAHSSVEHDYLQDGFWAMSREEELPNPGLTVKFLIRMQDVTDSIVPFLNKDMSRIDKDKKIEEIAGKIKMNAEKGTHYKAQVSSMFKGNQYFLFVYEIFEDVRLVGAPPSNIGKFGADTDNWMWPRHTGDFSVFRVYTAPDGSPAPYSKDNVPLKPKHFLPISLNGVEKGDYAMIMGYPGRTNRYLTSDGVEEIINLTGPFTIKVRNAKLGVMRKFMEKDPAVRIKYASKYAGVANYWKYYIGQTKQLKRNKVAERKSETEQQFEQWVNADPERVAAFGKVLQNIADAQKEINEFTLPITYFREAILGVEILKLANSFNSLSKVLDVDTINENKVKQFKESIALALPKFFKDYDMDLDRALLASMLELYYNDVPDYQHPAGFDKLVKKYKGDFNALANDVFAKSMLGDLTGTQEFLAKADVKKIDSDPAVQLINMFFNQYNVFMAATQDSYVKQNDNYKLYIAGLMQMMPDKQFAPDANSTMRLTYGNVLDYYPADAVHYNFYTTLDGVMQKEDSSVSEFVVFDKLKELYKNKDYGQYADKNGEIVTCFLNNCDITGGNSGSPVINDKGELIGIAFDGNWEAMSGDVAFEPELQRTISVDARYVLFIIDKFAGAKHLIDEMTIVKD